MVRVSPLRRDGLRFAATPDFMSVNEAEVLARALSRYTPTDDATQLLVDRAAEARAGQEFLDLFSIADARLWDPRPMWDQLTPAERLRIPLGRGTLGAKTVWLDMKEGGEEGMGPHGMLTGQTGSGKSKHLRSIVLALAMKHPPEAVQILLGDFKGEAEFAGLESLPHVVGVVSNLEKSAHKLDRFEDVVNGELAIRAETLNKAGYESVRDYEIARATSRPKLEPIGALVIILDEFSQLLKIRPEMAKVFDQVGLQGRSLWIHILNASQRAESGKMAGLIAQQTYSIGMKVKDAAQSRAAIGSSRAFEDLKKAPQGSAFLVVDDDHTRYRSFFTKAPFIAPKLTGAQRRNSEGRFVDVHRFGAAITPLPEDIEDDDEEVNGSDEDEVMPGIDAPTVESVLVEQIAKFGTGRLKRKMWLPPLEDLDEIQLDEIAREFWGRPWTQFSADAGLVIPIAREDDPLAHTQNLVSLNLAGAQGNVGIAGATGTGKSTVVRTLMTTLAISHSPQRVQFYAIDFGGGKLSSCAELPHVCGIAGRGNEEKIRRVVAEVQRLLRFRVRYWEQSGIDLSQFRARKFGTAAGAVPEDGHGDVFLIIDNIRSMQNEALDVHDRVVAMAEAASNYGIHLIITNDQWISIKPSLLQKCRSKIELRLANPVESEAGNKEAAKNMPDQPGRALQRGGKHMLVGVPYVHQRQDQATESESYGLQAAAATAAEIARLWSAQGVARAPELQVLPAEIGYEALPAAPEGMLKLGIGEDEMSTVALDLASTPHFYAVGSSKSGRTTLLRTLLASIMKTYTPQQAQVVLFDPSYELADAIDEAYRVVYGSTAAEVSQACAALGQRVLERRPPAGTPPAELRHWRPKGPKWFIVVDDLNLLSTAGSTQSALLPLVSGIETGRQVAMHVLAATNGERWYATGKMNKVIAAMETAGAGVLVMDGNRQEVIIDQVRPAIRMPGRGELYYRKSGGQLVQVALPPVQSPAGTGQ
jgi:DNA segregation ATPase FtsK/SpoIIIE, S-DNA-T family